MAGWVPQNKIAAGWAARKVNGLGLPLCPVNLRPYTHFPAFIHGSVTFGFVFSQRKWQNPTIRWKKLGPSTADACRVFLDIVG
jgi:hypothetical protein